MKEQLESKWVLVRLGLHVLHCFFPFYDYKFQLAKADFVWTHNNIPLKEFD